MSKYDVVLNIKVDQELKSTIEKFADENDITSSALVRNIIKQYFNKVGNLNEKQTYYYDHLLQEIINNREQIEDIQFKSNFGKNPAVKVESLGQDEFAGMLERIKTLEEHFTKYVPNNFSDSGDKQYGIEEGDMLKAKSILDDIKAEKRVEAKKRKEENKLLDTPSKWQEIINNRDKHWPISLYTTYIEELKQRDKEISFQQNKYIDYYAIFINKHKDLRAIHVFRNKFNIVFEQNHDNNFSNKVIKKLESFQVECDVAIKNGIKTVECNGDFDNLTNALKYIEQTLK